MLGRGHLRLLHPLPQRGPLGAAAHVSQADAQFPPADAAARARTCWATATTRIRSSIASWTSRPRTAWTSSASSTRSTTSGTSAARLDAVRRTGKHAEGTICYTTSPLHTVEKFVEMAQRLQDMGCDSICIKDMAALLRPQPAYDIVKGIKEKCGKDTIVHVHVHSTTGVTMVSLMKAIEAGADIVDTSISSLSLGPGHNPTEALVEMLEGTGYTTRLKKDRLLKIKDHFAKVRPRYAAFESKIIGVETEIFDSQIPGGMISNMESQLKQQGAGDRMKEVLAEVPRVRKDAGYPPLVTPSSQIVGTQAVFNVLDGPLQGADRRVRRPDAGLLRRDDRRRAIRRSSRPPPSTPRRSRSPAGRPISSSPSGTSCGPRRSALKGCNGTDEDVLTFAMFPQVAPKFFGTRAEGPKNVGKALADASRSPRPSRPTARPSRPTARGRSPAPSPTRSRSVRSRTR